MTDCTTQDDIEDLNLDDAESETYSDEDSDDDADPIVAERNRRARRAEQLKSRAGEPQKPQVVELKKLHPAFLNMLRSVLAE